MAKYIFNGDENGKGRFWIRGAERDDDRAKHPGDIVEFDVDTWKRMAESTKAQFEELTPEKIKELKAKKETDLAAKKAAAEAAEQEIAELDKLNEVPPAPKAKRGRPRKED